MFYAWQNYDQFGTPYFYDDFKIEFKVVRNMLSFRVHVIGK